MKNIHIVLICIFVFLAGGVGSQEQRAVVDGEGPTHADAAVFFAKFSGLFQRYVEMDASLSECVSFLNKQGIYFGLMEVVNGTEFTRKDCARVMGQIELVLTGEAEFEAGKVILPNGIDSWEEFCILNGVNYIEGYAVIVEAVEN